MVTITKSPRRTTRSAFYGRLAASIALVFLLWIGLRWFSLFAAVVLPPSAGNGERALRTRDRDDSDNRRQRSFPIIMGALEPDIISRQAPPQRQWQQLTESITAQLDELSELVPPSPPSENDGGTATEEESKFLSAARKECVPGRDDSQGEINPTTRMKRVCLRHVPLGKARRNGAPDAALELEERRTRQRPRIGIMIPPGRASRAFAEWVEGALKSTADGMRMPVEIVVTSRVPAYGYGKSHGYTKLVRLVALPLALAANDARSFASSEDSSSGAAGDPESGGGLSLPSAEGAGRALRLVMRWHCRLSHVSAHTAMLTLSLGDAIKEPADALAKILGFVWRDDWEWEGNGANHPPQGPPPQRGWKREAESLVEEGRAGGGSLQKMLEQTSLVLGETTTSARSAAFQKAIQGAFASEMKRSKGMTAWPCPSFWEGVAKDSGGDNDKPAAAVGGGDGDVELRTLQRLAEEMIPNCSDDDPFARCTVNKDRCEVKRDAECR